MFLKLRTIAVAALLPASALMADFSYTQTTSITGGQLAAMVRMAGSFGSKANQPTAITHYVKGDKLAAIGSTNGSIIDLSAETITEIDFQKKTYTVMTFAEMKQMMEQAAGKMGPASDAKFKISANPTGNAKQIAGVNAKEIVITMDMEMTDAKSGKSGSMKITTDSWISSDVAGYDQVRDLYKKMAGKISWMPGAGRGAMLGRPDMAKGMEEVAKEMAKMDGVPVLQVMKMGGGPGGGEIPAMTPEQQSQLDDAMEKAAQQQQATPSAGSAIASALGLPKFGSFGKKKPSADAPAPTTPVRPARTSAEPGVLIETTIESSGFSTAGIDSSKFEIPAGFKRVDSPRMGR